MERPSLCWDGPLNASSVTLNAAISSATAFSSSDRTRFLLAEYLQSMCAENHHNQ